MNPQGGVTVGLVDGGGVGLVVGVFVSVVGSNEKEGLVEGCISYSSIGLISRSMAHLVHKKGLFCIQSSLDNVLPNADVHNL